MSECRPPAGTPDGTWCVFRHVRRKTRPWLYMQWRRINGKDWWTARDDRDGQEPRVLWLLGWRFHSLATPPEDKP